MVLPPRQLLEGVCYCCRAVQRSAADSKIQTKSKATQRSAAQRYGCKESRHMQGTGRDAELHGQSARPGKKACFCIARGPESSSLRSLQLRRFARSGRVRSLASGAPLARLAPSAPSLRGLRSVAPRPPLGRSAAFAPSLSALRALRSLEELFTIFNNLYYILPYSII